MDMLINREDDSLKYAGFHSTFLLERFPPTSSHVSSFIRNRLPIAQCRGHADCTRGENTNLVGNWPNWAQGPRPMRPHGPGVGHPWSKGAQVPGPKAQVPDPMSPNGPGPRPTGGAPLWGEGSTNAQEHKLWIYAEEQGG